MKVSDYIVEYFINNGITDVFGYPGGMVTHLMDSLGKYDGLIKAHLMYNEQGVSFAACGYAQASGKIGVAFATSGPGATNLITGICNAYFDSVPTLFITGQVNSGEMKGSMGIRQRGFQETDIVSIARPITKYAKKVLNPSKIRCILDEAFFTALEGRKGPVLLDIPMDVFCSDIIPEKLDSFKGLSGAEKNKLDFSIINKKLRQARKPVFLFGNGVKGSGSDTLCKKVLAEVKAPVVTTMLAVDLASYSDYMYGYVGAYGTRSANFVLAKSDLVIALGARMDIRQVGVIRGNFAPDAQIIRVDIDPEELEYKLHDDDINICADIKDVLTYIDKSVVFEELDFSKWLNVCVSIKKDLKGFDDQLPNHLVNKISKMIDDSTAVITTDVGQNQVWVAQSFKFKRKQKALFSGGHGAMGYSLPAAIGASIGNRSKVYSFNGDGGIQMNIQELQVIAREKLPIKVIIINNNALGMIRHFQEIYFEGRFVLTVPEGGYTNPDFGKIAFAYGLDYHRVESLDDINEELFFDDNPAVIEIIINEPTYVIPKLRFGNPNQDQEPPLDRSLYQKLMDMDL